ncbi:MAG TPA: hypothetical protein VG965_06515 [Patescibacteria group bacterium]|nr:hypothetical protein [Patescibacteria group bacterium]
MQKFKFWAAFLGGLVALLTFQADKAQKKALRRFSEEPDSVESEGFIEEWGGLGLLIALIFLVVKKPQAERVALLNSRRAHNVL